MKKIISLLLVLVMTISVLGCASIAPSAESSVNITPAVKEALYAIVIASAISEKNAVNYAAKLQKKGYDAIACKTGSMVRVIIKGFETESDAYNQMRQMKAKSSEFANVWSWKVNDEIMPIQ